MQAYGFFKKNHISIYFDIIRIFSILISFEMGYFGGEENPELGILNFEYDDNTMNLILINIHKFSITIMFRLTFLD